MLTKIADSSNIDITPSIAYRENHMQSDGYADKLSTALSFKKAPIFPGQS